MGAASVRPPAPPESSQPAPPVQAAYVGFASTIQVNAAVTAGQTVCIVEAMKLFNEIEAEFGCIIEEQLVQDQQPVEFGTKLYRVRRL